MYWLYILQFLLQIVILTLGILFVLCEEETKILVFNPLNTKRHLLYLKTQFVARSKHFSSRL